MKVKIFAHGVDPDGITSHALIRKYHLPSDKVLHYYLDYPNFAENLARLSDVKFDRSRVYVADLNLNPEVEALGRGVFQLIKASNSSFAWFDHHGGSINNRAFLDEFCYPLGLSPDNCSSRVIAQELFGGVDKYANSLGDIAQAHDFHIESDAFWLGKQLQDLIKFRSRGKDAKRDLDELVNLLATEQVWDVNWRLYKDLAEEVTLFRDEKSEAYQELFRNVEYHVVAGKTIVISPAREILYMKDAPFYLQEHFDEGVDYFVAVFDDLRGSVSIFGKKGCTEEDPDLIRFCEEHHGGGRANMGGFYLGNQVTTEKYGRIKDQILESFKEAFKERM